MKIYYFFYISYKLDTWARDLINTDFTIGNCLFGALKLNRSDDPDKYRYSSYGIGFDKYSQFSWTDDSWDKNVVIFGVGNSYSVHVDNKKRIS